MEQLKRQPKRGLAIALSTFVLMLAITATAAAQNIGPTDGQYDPRSQQVGGQVDAGDPGDPANAGSLPFTGFDAILLLSVGGALLAGGLLIRRAAQSAHSD